MTSPLKMFFGCTLSRSGSATAILDVKIFLEFLENCEIQYGLTWCDYITGALGLVYMERESAPADRGTRLGG